MNKAKIQLSADELLLVQNGEWILTKNIIIEKVYSLFGSLAEEMKNITRQFSLPQQISQTTPKIYKGENYKGLPYVMLDYPRFFTKENIFAIRVLFWWANYFSITLHVKGEFKNLFNDALKSNIRYLGNNLFYLNITEDEWHHNIDTHNYIFLNEASDLVIQKYLLQASFSKLSAKINLNQWNDAEKLLLNFYEVLMRSLQH